MKVTGQRLGYRHQKVQRLRRLLRQRALRDAEGVFVIENAKVLDEVLGAGKPVETVFIAPTIAESQAARDVVGRAAGLGVRVYALESGVLERVTDTVTPQPVIAIVPRIACRIESIDSLPSAIVLVDVRDPGNAGTILRSAEASGIGAVIFCDGSVDVFNPKTVRASAGALVHVPVVAGGDPRTTLDFLEQAGFVRMATRVTGGDDYAEVDLTRRLAFVFGNEASGLPDDLADKIDEIATIPIAGRSESLNVGMAASILCFEAGRQRRAKVLPNPKGNRG